MKPSPRSILPALWHVNGLPWLVFMALKWNVYFRTPQALQCGGYEEAHEKQSFVKQYYKMLHLISFSDSNISLIKMVYTTRWPFCKSVSHELQHSMCPAHSLNYKEGKVQLISLKCSETRSSFWSEESYFHLSKLFEMPAHILNPKQQYSQNVAMNNKKFYFSSILRLFFCT